MTEPIILPKSTSRQPIGSIVGALARIRWWDVTTWSLLLLFVLLTILPLWWVARTALTHPNKVYTETTSPLPVDATTMNFERVLGMVDSQVLIEEGVHQANISVASLNFWIYLRNSLIFSSLVTFGQTLFSAAAAYAFARLRFPLRDTIFTVYLAGLMVPSILLFIPNFVLVRQLGLVGTFAGLVAPFFLMTPFAVFFMRQFFMSLSRELEEAAILDGATRLGVFWRIALPLTRGPLLTLALLVFVQSWNEYLWPLLVGSDEAVRVLTVALGVFRGQLPQGAPDWTGLMAGTAVGMVPTLLILFFFGRKLVDSIQFSGFK